MRFQIRHLFVTLIVAAAIAFWVAENGPSRSVDASYLCEIVSDFPTGFDSNASYVLIPKSELDATLANCQIWRDHETGDIPKLKDELPELPDFRPFNSSVSNIMIPRTEFQSPLLKQNRGDDEPFDCIAFWFKHGNGATSTMIRYRHNWKDNGLVEIIPNLEMTSSFNATPN